MANIGSTSERVTCTNRDNMGFDFGMQDPESCYLQSFRWLFQIEGVSGVAKALPPLQAARPSLNFKEQMVAHLVENIYYPVRPEWKPVTITLYEIRNSNSVPVGRNPVMEWVQQLYNPSPKTTQSTVAALGEGVETLSGDWFDIAKEGCAQDSQSLCFKRNATLCLYDGCGSVLEVWRFDNAWPQSVDWGDLDMGSSEILTAKVTLRYDRAWIDDPTPPSSSTGSLPGSFTLGPDGTPTFTQ